MNRHDNEIRIGQRLSPLGARCRWLNDGRKLLFLAQGKLLMLDSVSKSYEEVLTVETGFIDSFALSHDNHTIYFTRGSSESDIWMLTKEEQK